MYLPNGTLLHGGKYRIVRFIASGGFGCTYEVKHTLLGKTFAIKEFFPQTYCSRDSNSTFIVTGTAQAPLVNKLKKKFISEAVSIAELAHPSIVRVNDVFEENGSAYYVMDYIQGQSLKQIVDRKGRLSEKEALGYIRQICDALAYVHSHNRLHLDIKPGNIMIDNQGRAILIDFGASKQYDEENGENTSTLLGWSPGYAPLEQMGKDVHHFCQATDIYALGATLYKCLTGKAPLEANLLAQDEELTPLPADVSEATRRAVKSAMQTSRKNRPQNINEFLAILDDALMRPAEKTNNYRINELDILKQPLNTTEKISESTPKSQDGSSNGNPQVQQRINTPSANPNSNISYGEPHVEPGEKVNEGEYNHHPYYAIKLNNCNSLFVRVQQDNNKYSIVPIANLDTTNFRKVNPDVGQVRILDLKKREVCVVNFPESKYRRDTFMADRNAENGFEVSWVDENRCIVTYKKDSFISKVLKNFKSNKIFRISILSLLAVVLISVCYLLFGWGHEPDRTNPPFTGEPTKDIAIGGEGTPIEHNGKGENKDIPHAGSIDVNPNEDDKPVKDTKEDTKPVKDPKEDAKPVKGTKEDTPSPTPYDTTAAVKAEYKKMISQLDGIFTKEMVDDIIKFRDTNKAKLGEEVKKNKHKIDAYYNFLHGLDFDIKQMTPEQQQAIEFAKKFEPFLYKSRNYAKIFNAYNDARGAFTSGGESDYFD